MRQRCLRVKVDDQHAVTIKGCGVREMQSDGRLASATFEVGDRGAEGALVGGTFRHERPAVHFHAATDLVDFVQSVPTLTTVFLNLARGEGGVSGQTATECGLVHLEDKLGHFPA